VLGMLVRLVFVALGIFLVSRVVRAFRLVSSSMRGDYSKGASSKQTNGQKAGKSRFNGRNRNQSGFSFSKDDVVDVNYDPVKKEEEPQDQP